MSTTPFSIPKFRYIFSACWLIWGALHVALLYWYGYSLGTAVLDSFISNGLLAAICILLSNMFRFYLPRRDRYAYLLGLTTFLTIAWFFVSRFIIMVFISKGQDYQSFFALSAPVRLAIASLIIGSMVLLNVLWYIQQEQQAAEKRKTEAESLARDAELYNLRQQLQPHFLFNSLNSINALIGFKPTEARHMIQQLSDFLRGTLRKDNSQWSSLDEELNHLELYLDIEKVRFGHRLKTEIHADEQARARILPAMLLQPVVENAIKFGLYDTTEAITIIIKALATEASLEITVINPFDPASSPAKKGTGFGLSSVQRRMYLLFAQNGLLKTQSTDNLFTTTLIIPQPNDKSNNN